ncbi:L-serine ammonia-lyase, iron-sulfur-dependent, subunit alpha, partial [Cronobacter sakazakii]|uniref:L-serine ammonia-lyase, iron-sulfur-dependent, subunit alpha n=1 Tax=Cronobacter sakazakii TaxID=28141 RepID=UPI000D4319B8
SANQGSAATRPVVVVAEYTQASQEQLARALLLSHLTAVYIHSKRPTLSALCAASTASMGAAAGMAWLLGGDLKTISMASNSMV